MRTRGGFVSKKAGGSKWRGSLWLFIAFLGMSALHVSLAQTATLLGPVTFGSPDQHFGKRRPVTAADKAAIAAYRSGKKPLLYSTNFATPAEFQANWTPQLDDQATLKSCRQASNLEPSPAGLRLKTMIATGCKAKWSTAYADSKAKYTYGFFEATIKIADIKGLNNAFWLTTSDHFEIDIVEASAPNVTHFTLHHWPANKTETHAAVGFAGKFNRNLAYDFHDYGLIWTPTELIFEVDGEPIAAIVTDGSIKTAADVRLSTALANFAGPIPSHPEGHNAVIRSVRICGL